MWGDMVSDIMLQLSFKKQALIMCWCTTEEKDLQWFEKTIKILFFFNCKSLWGQISSYTSTKTSCNRLNEIVMKNLSFIKPDTKEICKKKIKQCHSSKGFF